MSPLTSGDFAAFFSALHEGREPFAWQSRLLESLAQTGEWPKAIGAPTGTGKSSVIEVHLFAQALDYPGQRPPRRLVLTVDRRALVDDHWEHALQLQRLLQEADGGILRRVGRALLALDGAEEGRVPGEDERSPFDVRRIRGGEVPDRDWVLRPAACQVITATPDMLGSRLLFRGYGTSRLARPREAGLLAFDTVMVLDEAHLNRQLARTVERVESLVGASAKSLGVPGLCLVRMTATQASEDNDAVGILLEDLSATGSDLLRARLLRPKPLSILTCPALPVGGSPTSKQVDEAATFFADRVLGLLGALKADTPPDTPCTVGCLVNTVPMAIAVSRKLSQALSPGSPTSTPAGAEPGAVVTLVGRMRPYELKELRVRYPGLFTLEGDSRVAVVVATQTLEVGVDIDFAGMVTELAPGSALAQRAGRVNRSGRRDRGPIEVVCPPSAWESDARIGPYQGDELAEALEWITRCADSPSGLEPWRLYRPGTQYAPPVARLRRPVLQRVETWDVSEWARTSDEVASEPWLDLWLSDDLEPDMSVGLVMRQGLPEEWVSAQLQVAASPVLSDEVFPVRLEDARAVLSTAGRAFIVRDEIGAVYGEEAARRARPGDVIVIDRQAGVTGGGVVAPAVPDQMAPPDVGELGAPPRNLRRWVRLGPETPMGEILGRQRVTALLEEAQDALNHRTDDEHESVDLVSLVERYLSNCPRDDERTSLLSELLKAEPDVVHPDPGATEFWLVVQGRAFRDDDDSSLQVRSPRRGVVELTDHESAVEAEARWLAQRVGLSRVLAEALAVAGQLHDEGKADARFQRSLRWRPADYPGRTLAKSGRLSRDSMREARRLSGLPANWRHEQLSAATVWAKLADEEPVFRDLVTRLVGTSHGYGRHEFPHVGNTLVGAEDVAQDASRELYDGCEWERVLDRTDQRFGPWGCAYLEALLRAADGVVSRRGL